MSVLYSGPTGGGIIDYLTLDNETLEHVEVIINVTIYNGISDNVFNGNRFAFTVTSNN